MESFSGIYAGRRVLVTGHTGFKGGWLCHWLLKLGAQVHGIALAPETTPSLFQASGLETLLASHRLIDLTAAAAIRDAIVAIRPEIVFHLAAQPLVRRSYREPAATFATNVMGTVHVLESLRAAGSVRVGVMITSDKCYENREWLWGYREHEAMGGHDPYSASKGASEIVVASWRRSFLKNEGIRVASARAGNVIGGGDWSEDRIVCDAMRCLSTGQMLPVRNPGARRPWQHVLEPLGGYLLLGMHLLGERGDEFADGWNFGPETASIRPVADLADRLVRAWGSGGWIDRSDPANPHEASWLALSWEKAFHRLGWHPVWGFDQTIERTVAWYRQHLVEQRSAAELIQQQLEEYVADARARGLSWAKR